MIPLVIGVISLAIWVYLLFCRGGFWRMRNSDTPERQQAADVPLPKVAVFIPARNEAEFVTKAISSLVHQNYPGPLDFILIDDNSTDGTADVASAAVHQLSAHAQFRIVHASPLPLGWTGKIWALHEGIQQCARMDADYFLLTDADIVHSLDNIAELVNRAESGGFDLVSVMVKLRCSSWAERALIPAFVFFFFMLYPPAWVSRPDRRSAAAAGGCILIRRQSLERIGGIAAVAGELIDDCALASKVKRSGGRIWLGLAPNSFSIRPYQAWADIEHMVARTAFTQLRYSVVLLLATVIGMFITFLAPILLLWTRPTAAALGAGAWIIMCMTFLPCLRFYGLSWFWAPLLPLIASFYGAATVHSAVLYRRGVGGLWKGRVQDTSAP